MSGTFSSLVLLAKSAFSAGSIVSKEIYLVSCHQMQRVHPPQEFSESSYTIRNREAASHFAVDELTEKKIERWTF